MIRVPRPASRLASFLLFLIPSFLTPILLGAPRRPTSPQPLSSTAYLDGLRGVAALVVYNYHWGYSWVRAIRRGYGVNESEHFFLQRPVIRALHSGRASVMVFFVISGYVISVKALTTIHQRRMDKTLDALAGSLLRRPFRLYIPIVVSTFIQVIMLRLNVFLPGAKGIWPAPKMQATWAAQLQDWVLGTVSMINPFRAIFGRGMLHYPRYNSYLWTIPVEFKGTLVVFLLILAFANAKRWIHISACTVCIFWLYQQGDIDMALFITGMVFAELSLVCGLNSSSPIQSLDKEALPVIAKPGSQRQRQRHFSVTIRHIATITAFILALHFIGFPLEQGSKTPGYRTMSIYVPSFYANDEGRRQQFWASMGATLLFPALMFSPPVSLRWFSRKKSRWPMGDESTLKIKSHGTDAADLATNEEDETTHAGTPLLQAPFTTAFAQYLGKISYSLYLVHGPINNIGARLLNPAKEAWTDAGKKAKNLDFEGQYATAQSVRSHAWHRYMYEMVTVTLLISMLLIWTCDLFWRAVDIKAVQLTRRISTLAKRETDER